MSDSLVSNTIQLVLPDGKKKIINCSGNVLEIIKNNCMDKNYENYALVFFGRKLAFDQKLDDIEYLTKDRPVYLVCQNNHQKLLDNEVNVEINKKLQECRASYRLLIKDAPHQLSAEAFKLLLSYMHENNCKNYKQALNDFPNITSDHVGCAAICDFRLLIQFVMKDDKFVFEHPDCLSIFKKALDNIAAKFSSTSTSVRFPNSMSDLPSLNQIAVTGTPEHHKEEWKITIPGLLVYVIRPILIITKRKWIKFKIECFENSGCLFNFPISCISVMLIFCPMIIFIFLIYYGISFANGVDTIPNNEKLPITFYNASTAQLIVDKLCNSWKEGIYSGDFCETLCTKNWSLIDYFEGGNKKVLKMHINGSDIILKMQHPFLDQYDQQIDFKTATDEQFMDMVLDIVNDHLRLDWPRRYKKHLIRKLWPNYKEGLELKESEKRSIWALIQQNEFINQAIIQMSRVTPKILGVCGHSYQSEQLIPFRMKPYYLNLKAKILVHLMGSLKLFYEFLNEPLQWCDVKFENLGLSASYPKDL
ncbi:PIP49_C domain-containing protein [Meloidogyne graminicola]|uniref:PIP49_C domain-containing protein n=1 Tax=Meloidogyne graminicola TaxID=189291 RepID=A0A8S9ZZC0_9BILA|nr:PIP49_C domain-containing protein [Meloidogyne graminicola]